MHTFFAWKTIDEDSFVKDVTYAYGGQPGNFAGWNSLYDDLEVTVTIMAAAHLPDLADYLDPGETAGMMLNWTGDHKFSGCSPVVACHFPDPVTLQCRIPKGHCAGNFQLECLLVVHQPSGGDSDSWGRPPGSILATIPIEDNEIGEGAIFPMLEYSGDGRHLIRWDFSDNEDLDMSPMSGFTVLIDVTHPFIALNPRSDASESLLRLMIMQGFVRKAFSEGIFGQLTEKEEQNQAWKPKSIGASFHLILNKIRDQLNVDSLQELKRIYQSRPERIDQCVDELFSPALKIK